VYRAHPSAAPDWPQPPGLGGYRVEIDGDPIWRLDLAMSGADGTVLSGGELATATRVVNAIPAVCAAEPGILTPVTMPIQTGRHRVRPPA
jgi:4-hydroxy-tetrahydrodipicolinate reductase